MMVAALVVQPCKYGKLDFYVLKHALPLSTYTGALVIGRITAHSELCFSSQQNIRSIRLEPAGRQVWHMTGKDKVVLKLNCRAEEGVWSMNC
jgi:hypothetical protein